MRAPRRRPGPTTAGPSCSTHDASPPMCAWQNARTFAIGSSPSSSVKVNSRSSSTLMGKDTSTPLGGAGSGSGSLPHRRRRRAVSIARHRPRLRCPCVVRRTGRASASGPRPRGPPEYARRPPPRSAATRAPSARRPRRGPPPARAVRTRSASIRSAAARARPPAARPHELLPNVRPPRELGGPLPRRRRGRPPSEKIRGPLRPGTAPSATGYIHYYPCAPYRSPRF